MADSVDDYAPMMPVIGISSNYFPQAQSFDDITTVCDLTCLGAHPDEQNRNEQPPLGSSKLVGLTLEYDWSELLRATGDFNDARILGTGHAGNVYQGILEEGLEVAVKVLNEPLSDGFEDEVRLLSRCHHPNVVMLLGFGIEGGGGLISLLSGRSPSDIDKQVGPGVRCALVYELLSGGNAFYRLHSPGSNYPWRERLSTIVQISRGLAHLHKHRPEVFHRDIKTANILFGNDGMAKIADFGLACTSKCKAERSRDVDIANGTPGYGDPEYTRTNVVTEASEVYSMGMVLLELLTARVPAELSADGTQWQFLLAEVRPELDNAVERVMGMLDARIQWPHRIAADLANLALLCIHPDASRRPCFLEIVNIVNGFIPEGTDAMLRSEDSTSQGDREIQFSSHATPIQSVILARCDPQAQQCGRVIADVEIRLGRNNEHNTVTKAIAKVTEEIKNDADMFQEGLVRIDVAIPAHGDAAGLSKNPVVAHA
jgi:serine/threonine protein kinase